MQIYALLLRTSSSVVSRTMVSLINAQSLGADADVEAAAGAVPSLLSEHCFSLSRHAAAFASEEGDNDGSAVYAT